MKLGRIFLGVMLLTLMPTLASSAEFDPAAEVKAAIGAVNDAHQNLPGMDGLGVIPEPQLQVIQGLLIEAEKLVREARKRSQSGASRDDLAWAVGYARAGVAMAKVADEYRQQLGY